MEKDADFESHGIETDSRPLSKNKRKKKEDPLKISEEEALRRLERDLTMAEDAFGVDEDLDVDDDANESVDEGKATSEGEILIERARPKVYTIKKLSRHISGLARSLYGEELGEQEEWLARNRPRKRGECPEFRPCPFLSCRHHLYLDITRYKGIKFNFPDVDPDEMPFSCSLDVAEGGKHTFEEVAALLNMTRERVRQLEVLALDRSYRTIRDPSRRLPDGGYLKWEDVEEYGDEDVESIGLEEEDSDDAETENGGNDGGSDVSHESSVVREESGSVQLSATPALDFSLGDEE